MTDFEHIRPEMRDNVAIIHLADPKLMDSLDINELEQELMRYVEENQPSAMVVSFDNVTRCSSSVMNGLLLTKHAAGAYGGKLALCEMRDDIRKAFDICQLPFDIRATLHEAVDALQ